MRVAATCTDDVSLLDKAERCAWWQQCKLKYSSMNCFIDYIPQGIEGSDEDDDIIEREHIKTKLAARGITLKDTREKDDTEHEIAYRKPKFELFDRGGWTTMTRRVENSPRTSLEIIAKR